MTVRALVVGAGPAGLGAAVQLARWCETVDVAEARPRARLRHAGEHLPPAALSSMASLGLEALLDDPRHGTSSGIRSAWGENAFAEREYFFTVPGCGVNLRRDIFDEALAQYAERNGARLRFKTRLTRLMSVSDGYHATLRGPEGNTKICADIVIDATGRHARAARQLGATVERADQLVGIVGRIDGCEPDEDVGRLHIEAHEHGWWYGVQFCDGQLVCTYMTDASLVRVNPQGARGMWHEHLSSCRSLVALARTGHWPGTVDVFDAATQTIRHTGNDSWLAVGDAATAFDPLSSWGITKGIVDGHDGASALERRHKGNAGAVKAHRDRQRSSFRHYREQRTRFYRAEQRWPQSRFWRARQNLQQSQRC